MNIDYTKLSPNRSPRTSPIRKITIHHCAMINPSLETLGNGFAKPERQASANYGIDSEGRIGLFVPENNRAWTSSSKSNDDQAITIEVANCKGAPNWEVSDKALSALVELCRDICDRYDIDAIYTGKSDGTITTHKMFAATACPGPYLESKMDWIVEQLHKSRIYRVQCGAFTNIDKAKDLQAKLKAAGFASFISW